MLQFAPIKFDWGGLFGQVKSVVIKIFFSRGVTLQHALWNFGQGGQSTWSSQIYRDPNFLYWGGVYQFYTQKHAVQTR